MLDKKEINRILGSGRSLYGSEKGPLLVFWVYATGAQHFKAKLEIKLKLKIVKTKSIMLNRMIFYINDFMNHI